MFDFYSLIAPLLIIMAGVLLIKNQRYRVQVESAGPDILRFDMNDGALVAAGYRVSRLLGYSHSEQCCRDYHRHVHLKNASLGHLVSGRMMTNVLSLQDVNGMPLAQGLRVRSERKGRFLDLSVADQTERRAHEPGKQGGQERRERASFVVQGQPGRLSHLMSLFEAQGRTDDQRFHAIYDRLTGGLFVPRSLLLKMGFASRDRWLAYRLWSQCLLDERQRIPKESHIDLADWEPQVSLVTVRGEALLFELDIAPFPYEGLFAQANGLAPSSVMAAYGLDASHHVTSSESFLEGTTGQVPREMVDSQLPAEQRYQWIGLRCCTRNFGPGAHDLASSGTSMSHARATGDTIASGVKRPSDLGKEPGDYSELRILVLEDDILIRQGIQPMLEKFNAAISTANTLADGLRYLAEEEPFDVVLTDLNLGSETSRPLIKKLRVEYPGTTLLLMTGSPDAIEGAHQVITKPFNLDELSMTMEWGLMRSKVERYRRGSGTT